MFISAAVHSDTPAFDFVRQHPGPVAGTQPGSDHFAEYLATVFGSTARDDSPPHRTGHETPEPVHHAYDASDEPKQKGPAPAEARRGTDAAAGRSAQPGETEAAAAPRNDEASRAGDNEATTPAAEDVDAATVTSSAPDGDGDDSSRTDRPGTDTDDDAAGAGRAGGRTALKGAEIDRKSAAPDSEAGDRGVVRSGPVPPDDRHAASKEAPRRDGERETVHLAESVEAKQLQASGAERASSGGRTGSGQKATAGLAGDAKPPEATVQAAAAARTVRDERGTPVVEIEVEVARAEDLKRTVASAGMSRSTAGVRELTTAARHPSAAEHEEKSRLRNREGDTDRTRDKSREVRLDRSGPRVAVRDLRAHAGNTGNQDSETASRRQGESTESTSEPPGTSRPADSRGEHDQSGTFRLETPSSSTGTARSLDAFVRSADLPTQLRQAMHDQLNGEIVRSARLIVRSGESGEIRLHLKPEELGSVRISLHMQDGHIAGRIIVDNQTVREAFEQNLAALQRAFQESGLEASGVEVSVADSGGQQDGAESSASRTARGQAAARFGHVVPDLGSIEEIHELVDMVV